MVIIYIEMFCKMKEVIFYMLFLFYMECFGKLKKVE